jgi:hypothetical protein
MSQKMINGCVLMIIPLQYQLANQDCQSGKGLSDDKFVNKFKMSRMQSSIRKMATNGKGKGKIENVYLAINGNFFQ